MTACIVVNGLMSGATGCEGRTGHDHAAADQRACRDRAVRFAHFFIDRDKARVLNVPIPNIFETLAINLGTSYVNGFNAFGRVYQVRAQADEAFRLEPSDILDLKVRSVTGALVPMDTLVSLHETTGPTLVQRYNMCVSVPIQGNAAPGASSGQALDSMEEIALAQLPAGRVFEWTELAF